MHRQGRGQSEVSGERVDRGVGKVVAPHSPPRPAILSSGGTPPPPGSPAPFPPLTLHTEASLVTTTHIVPTETTRW
ncbi:hypothetical protein E2C01_016648 [Portunus trituberculatus]|uniref:Uncharacterized protein n=1 Tax=Portunus trituberculatus TaxID=210409 RepID=A0A5B7DPL3_PORTR|nr:hypothetical protein [Portunus trituberculatus]